MDFSPLTTQLIDLALTEDLVGGDLTSDAIFSADDRGTFHLLAKVDLVLCGTGVFDHVVRRFDAAAELTWRASDGELVPKGTVFLVMTGKVRGLLKAERTGLNFLQRMSGIATQASVYANALSAFDTEVVDTRKTLPGWRELDKYAVRCGGARNHRFNLGSGVMIKDNHIAAAGSIEAAVEKVRRSSPHTVKIEVEVTDHAELREAIAAGADIVLLDNMDDTMMAEAVKITRASKPGIVLEASGGVTLERLAAIAKTGVDIISVGALTHTVAAADISMRDGSGE